MNEDTALIEKPEDIYSVLTRRFEPDEIEWRVLRCGKTTSETIWAQLAPYVDARAIQNRLDSVLTFAGWQYETFPLLDGIGGRLGIRIGDEWIWKSDGASCTTEIEPIKGGISDALKRCANMFGIGRYLYSAREVWAKDITEGKPPADKRGWALRIYSKTHKIDAWCPPPNINDYLPEPETADPPPQQRQQQPSGKSEQGKKPPPSSSASGHSKEWRDLYDAISIVTNDNDWHGMVGKNDLDSIKAHLASITAKMDIGSMNRTYDTYKLLLDTAKKQHDAKGAIDGE